MALDEYAGMTAHPQIAPPAIRRAATNDNGIDPSPPTCPRALDTARIERAALQLAGSVIRLEVSGELDAQRASPCLRQCLRLSIANARMPNDLEHAPALETLITLVRLERALMQLRRKLAPIADARTQAALRELNRLLAPIAGTSDAVRAHVSRLAQENCTHLPVPAQAAVRG